MNTDNVSFLDLIRSLIYIKKNGILGTEQIREIMMTHNFDLNSEYFKLLCQVDIDVAIDVYTGYMNNKMKISYKLNIEDFCYNLKTLEYYFDICSMENIDVNQDTYNYIRSLNNKEFNDYIDTKI
jgi:hypothetical protein